MKRKVLKALAILMLLLSLCSLVGIFTVPGGFAKSIAQGIYLLFAAVFGVAGYVLARKGWGEMKDPNFSPRQKITIGALLALILAAAVVYWLGFYVAGGEGDLEGLDYQVAHVDSKGNVTLDFTQSDTWVIDWSNLTFEEWLSISYDSGKFTNGAQKVRYKLYVKNFFGGYEDTDRDMTFIPGEAFSSKLPEGRPFAVYRILLQSVLPDLSAGTFSVTGGTLDPGW